MDRITIQSDNQPDLEFTGAEVARVSSARPSAPRWTELILYRIDGYTWESCVLQIIGHTTKPGEHTRHAWLTAHSTDSLVKQAGHGRLLRDLYKAAGIDTTIRIPE